MQRNENLSSVGPIPTSASDLSTAHRLLQSMSSRIQKALTSKQCHYFMVIVEALPCTSWAWFTYVRVCIAYIPLKEDPMRWLYGVCCLGIRSYISAAGANNGVNVDGKASTSVVFLTTTGLSERKGPSVGNPGTESAPSPFSGALVLFMRWHHGNSREESHKMSAEGTHFHVDGF